MAFNVSLKFNIMLEYCIKIIIYLVNVDRKQYDLIVIHIMN